MTKPTLTAIGAVAVLAAGLSSCAEPTADENQTTPDAAAASGTPIAASNPPAASSPPAKTGDSAPPTHAPPSSAEPDPAETNRAKPKPAVVVGLSQGATFSTYTNRAMAITYDTVLVPEGATISLVRNHGVDSTSLSVQLAGLQPDYSYAAHVHIATCGGSGTDAGPPYQNRPDSSGTASGSQAATDNELWLALGTGADGTAASSATVDWPIRPGEGYSLILHATGTDGQAPEPDDRVGCFVLARA